MCIVKRIREDITGDETFLVVSLQKIWGKKNKEKKRGRGDEG